MATKTFKIGLSNTDKQNMAQDVYERVIALTFAEYDSANTYNEGDFVVYDDTLYQCKEDNVTGAWDSSKWEQATLQDLLDDVEGAVASVNGKANIIDLENGTLVVAKALSAKSIENVSEESGTVQETPFIAQGTGTNNNTDETPTSPVGKQLEKQGNTVVVNQKMSSFNSQSDGGISLTPNQDGSVTLDGNANQGYSVSLYPSSTQLPVLNHTYYFDANCSDENVVVEISGYTLSRKNKGIVVNTFTDQQQFILKVVANAVLDNVKAKPIVIDLTQWFNGDIPQDLLDNPSHFFRYYNGSLAYNAYALVNSDGRYLECGGRNVWDEVTEQGTIDADGQNASSTTLFRSKNYIKVIPNREYTVYYGSGSGSTTTLYYYWYDENKNFISSYFMTFTNKQDSITAPSNAKYLRIRTGGSAPQASYANDITVSLYYETGDGYDEYYPYEQSKVYDTGTEVLRKAGSVKDSKAPDGTITRRIGTYTFTGEESWTLAGGSAYYYTTIPNIKRTQLSSDIPNLQNDFGAESVSIDYIYGQVELSQNNNLIGVANNDNYRFIISLKLYNSISSLIGKTIYFELAEPTTEEGTPFAENIEINDYGTMNWLDTNSALVDVPQGCKIFYPADYVLLMDDLNTYVEGDVTKLAKKSDLPTAPQTWAESLPGYDATKTQVLKNVEGTLTWVDEA